MQVFLKRTHLLLLCLILISYSKEIDIFEQKANLARHYQCEVTNSVDYLIQMHQVNKTIYNIKNSSSSNILELSFYNMMQFTGDFITVLSQNGENVTIKYMEETKFLENNQYNYYEINVQEIVFQINDKENIYIYVISFSSDELNIQVLQNSSEILIAYDKKIDSVANAQLLFGSPNQIDTLLFRKKFEMNKFCREENCKKQNQLLQYINYSTSFIAKSISKAQFSVNSLLFNYQRIGNTYLAKIISQNTTPQLILQDCQFANQAKTNFSEIGIEINQYICSSNSLVFSLILTKDYEQEKQIHFLIAFEVPFGTDYEQLIQSFVLKFQQITCKQNYKNRQFLTINALLIQIKQVESESQFEKYQDERQIQSGSSNLNSDIIIQPFQNFVISDDEQEEDDNKEELEITNNIDQKPIYKTLNGIYTPQVPDFFLNEDEPNQNDADLDQSQQETIDQQSLIQKEEDVVKETSDFIIYEDPISWNAEGQQEVEVFDLQENSQNDNEKKENTNIQDSMIIEQAKVEEINFDEIPQPQQINNEQVIQEIQPIQQPQQEQAVQQDDQPQKVSSDNQSDQIQMTDSDYSDYYYDQYTEDYDYDRYYRRLHHNQQLKHNFHHHKYIKENQSNQGNNLRRRRHHNDEENEYDDILPIVADRIIIEYNFANKLKEEKIKMHGDDVEEEQPEKEEDIVLQPNKQKKQKINNKEQVEDEEEQPKSRQKKKQAEEDVEQNESTLEEEQKAPKNKQQRSVPQKKNQPQKEEVEEEQNQEEEQVTAKKSNPQTAKKQKAKPTQQDEEVQDQEDEEKPPKKQQKVMKKQKEKEKIEEENDEMQDEGNVEQMENEDEGEEMKEQAQVKKKKKQVEQEEEECDEGDEQQNAEEKQEQNNDEVQGDQPENEQDECHCEKKKKNKKDKEEEQEEGQVEEEKDEANNEEDAQKEKKKKKGKKKQKQEEEEQYDYYGRYVRNHPYFENRNRHRNDEDMYWRYRCMNRQVRNQGYPFNWNPYQHRRYTIEQNAFHRMNPFRQPSHSGCVPNTVRQRFCNQGYGMPVYKGAYSNQDQMLRDLAYKHAQQQYAKQQVQSYRDQVGYFNCYGQDYYRPEYYEAYQGAIQDDPRYQVINRAINDPNVFSPFDESLYYRNVIPQNINQNMVQQNIKLQEQTQTNNTSSCFQVYDQCNFQGNSINLCGENPLLPQGLNGFKIFSYIVPQNVEIKFTQSKENQGELSTLEGSQECLQFPYQLIPHMS